MATVIFKPTEACNARCVYCDVVHKPQHSKIRRMPLETLELFFRRINELLVERPTEEMDVVWHGGEPFLLGPEYFTRALEFQERHCAGTKKRIRHSIQSNLTLFSRELAQILKKLGIKTIGSSYEPIADVRGLGKRRDWKRYNRQFMDAVALLEEEGLNWGVIYVVTRLALERPLEIFNFLANFSPRGAFMLNPVLVYERDLPQIKITPQEYVEFLGAIFPEWWRRRSELPTVEPFASLVRNLVEGENSLMCSDSGSCAYHHINLLPDGSLSHCGRSADWGLLDYGSIFERSFAQVLADPQREVLVQRNSVLPQTECKGCRFWEICHGGCPLDAWSAERSFMHKSEWCYAKRGFIEKYLEPLVNGAPAKPEQQRAPRRVIPIASRARAPQDERMPWINPVGGLGDTLMMSGVLKAAFDEEPARRFNLVERTKYRLILDGHPAIGRIGHPPPGARFMATDYWNQPGYLLPGARPYQLLASMFGLKTPIDECLYVPWPIRDEAGLSKLIPRKRFSVAISCSSDSPRKQMSVAKWERLVAVLDEQDIGVVQLGKLRDPYIRAAYSLLGMTTPRQLIGLLPHFDAVLTVDNFVMHASHLCGVPAVVLWGPTDHRVYGYAGHVHLQASLDCEYAQGCIGPKYPQLYQVECPQGAARCMETIPPESIGRSVVDLLAAAPQRRMTV